MGARGPAPLPANVKLFTGRGHGRDAGGSLVPDTPAFKRAIPEKPDGLGPLAARLWDQVCAELPRLNLLKELDGPSLEVFCETYQRWHDAVQKRRKHGLLAQTSQGMSKAPWITIEETAAKAFFAFCHEYGLTPSAELNLASIPKRQSGDQNNDLFGE